MTHQLRVHIALAEDPGLAVSNHVVAPNYDSTFWPLR